MGIWKTIKTGTLAIMLAASLSGKTKAAPTKPIPNCSRLETIAKREAAGIPKDLAKITYDLSTSLRQRTDYRCTVVKKTKGRFDPAKSYDVYRLTGKDKRTSFIRTLNAVSDDNIERYYPPLVNSLITYVAHFNLIYADKRYNLGLGMDKNFEPNKVSIHRFAEFSLANFIHPFPRTLKGYRIYHLASLGYKFSKTPRGVKKELDKAGAQQLPLFPEFVLPYTIYKPDYTKLTPKPPRPKPRATLKTHHKKIMEKQNKKRVTKVKKRKPLGLTAGMGIIVTSHPVTSIAGGLELQTGYQFRTKPYQQIIPELGIYGIMITGERDNTGLAQQCLQGNCPTEPSYKINRADLYGGTIGTYFELRLHKYLSLRINLGLAIETLKIDWRSSDKKNYSYLGTEAGAGLCANIGSNTKTGKQHGLRFCLSYQMRYMDYSTDIKERIERKVRPDSHGGILTMELPF